jgi:hypothetical protein
MLYRVRRAASRPVKLFQSLTIEFATVAWLEVGGASRGAWPRASDESVVVAHLTEQLPYGRQPVEHQR